jgi:hypothetical protein
MRTTIFAFLSMMTVAGFSGCGDSGNTTPMPKNDLSVKVSPDLTQPLNGCNGLSNCIIDCNDNNPVQSCYDDCDAGATQKGLDTFNALIQCIDDNCFGMGAAAHNADSGKSYCDPMSNDPYADPVCNDCGNRIFAAGGACRTALGTCQADKP